MKSVTRFSLSLLSVCILSSMIAACGGGGDGDAAGNSNQENPTPLEIPQQPPVGNVANPYPEPKQDVVIPPFLIELMGRKSKALLLFKNRWTTIY